MTKHVRASATRVARHAIASSISRVGDQEWGYEHTAARLRRRLEGIREAEPPPRPALLPAARHGKALRPQLNSASALRFPRMTRKSLYLCLWADDTMCAESARTQPDARPAHAGSGGGSRIHRHTSTLASSSSGAATGAAPSTVTLRLERAGSPRSSSASSSPESCSGGGLRRWFAVRCGDCGDGRAAGADCTGVCAAPAPTEHEVRDESYIGVQCSPQRFEPIR
jgi:hypothetical protein